MKSKKQKAAEYAALKADKERRESLVAAAVEKWGIKDCLSALWQTSSRDEEKEITDWFKEEMEISKGAIIINPQSIAEEARIHDFLDTIYPYENDKQMALFAA